MPFVRPTRLRSGALLQSGIPKQAKTLPEPFNGVVRGVVMATYRVDEQDHPLVPLGITPTAIWCDVLAVGNFQGGSRYFFLPGCQVCQPFGGIHKGSVFVPRATTRLLGGKSLSSVTPQDVNQMDGDWVLVQFLDGRTNQPVITGTLPHPSRDVGDPNDDPAGKRQRLRLIDGNPLFFLQNGSFFGIDTDGNCVIDTTGGNSGDLTETGAEASGGASNGNVQVNMPATGTFAVQKSGSNVASLSGVAAGASMTLGDGSAHVALAEPLASWWALQISPWLMAATGSPTPPPPLSPSVTSGAVAVPSRSA